MKFRILAFMTLLVLVFGFTLYNGKAEDSHTTDTRIILIEGKNLVEVESPVLVKEIVVLNPDIEYVSYFDYFLNKHVAYINVFGGVGDNFIIEPGRFYEISVRKKVELVA